MVVISHGLNQTFDALDGVTYLSTIDEVESFTALNNMHSDLVPELTAALQEMKADGTYDAIINGLCSDTNTKRVLHISSYSPEDSWDSDLQNAMLSVFEQDDNILYYNVPLNSARYHSAQDMAKKAYSAIRSMAMEDVPDLVIVSGNAALNFIMEYGYQLLDNTQIIYCGITCTDTFFEEIEGKYYGLREYVSALDNINIIENLCPNATEVLIVNAGDLTDLSTKVSVQNDLADYNGKLKIN